MSLRALRTLLAIIGHGNFSKAGDALGLTQSAVSLQVKGLEREFGVKLFDRSLKQPVLTDAGRIVAARAREIVGSYDRIPDALSGERALIGRLRVGAIQTALAGPVPDALVQLRQTHPRLQVKLYSGMSSELAQLVSTGHLDAAITTAPVRPYQHDLLVTPLYEDDFWIIGPARPEPACEPLELLRELPFIEFNRGAWAGQIVADELQRIGISAHADMVLDSQEVIVRMVASGLGVAVVALSRHVLDTLPPLFRRPFGDPQLKRPVVLLQRHDQPTHRFARALSDEVRAATIKLTHHLPKD